MVSLTPAGLAFLGSLLFCITMGFFSSSVFALWVLMEVSVILFSGFIISEQSQKVESASKYFLTQAFLGAGVFFYFQMSSWLSPEISSLVFISLILCKLGMAPFHFWVVGVAKGLSWKSLMVFLGPQKLFPFLLAGAVWGSDTLLVMIGISGLLSGVLGYCYGGFNEVLAFSSMVSSAVILALFLLDSDMGVCSFLAYCCALGAVLSPAKVETKMGSSVYTCFCLSMLGGAPPGPVFLFKYSLLCSLVGGGVSVISVVLFLASFIIAVPLYLKMIISMLYGPEGEHPGGPEVGLDIHACVWILSLVLLVS